MTIVHLWVNMIESVLLALPLNELLQGLYHCADVGFEVVLLVGVCSSCYRVLFDYTFSPEIWHLHSKW